MAALIWDDIGTKFFENGVSTGVLYLQVAGAYPLGVPWNGLTGVTENPSGAELTDLWANNSKYGSLRAPENYGLTIEAFTYPDEFAVCDGSAALATGVKIGQQSRARFGFAYRSEIGNDESDALGYKLHLVYGATASPSERAHQTVNESPEATPLSWEIGTNPVAVPGYNPTANVEIDSRTADPTKLAALEEILYGSAGVNPRLPLPNEVMTLMTGVSVAPTSPTFVASTGIVTIPTKAGVVYKVDGVVATAGPQAAVNGGVTTIVTAVPATGYYFPSGTNTTWTFISTKA